MGKPDKDLNAPGMPEVYKDFNAPGMPLEGFHGDDVDLMSFLIDTAWNDFNDDWRALAMQIMVAVIKSDRQDGEMRRNAELIIRWSENKENWLKNNKGKSSLDFIEPLKIRKPSNIDAGLPPDKDTILMIREVIKYLDQRKGKFEKDINIVKQDTRDVIEKTLELQFTAEELRLICNQIYNGSLEELLCDLENRKKGEDVKHDIPGDIDSHILEVKRMMEEKKKNEEIENS